MKVALIFVSLLVFVIYTEAYTYTGYPNFDYPNQCYYEEENLVMKHGETKKLKNECCKVYCSNKDSYIKECCGLVPVHPGCRLVADTSKSYPDCCNKEVCN